MIRPTNVFHMAVLCLILFSCSREKDSIMQLDERWLFRVDPEDAGAREQWYVPSEERSGWEEVAIVDRSGRHNREGAGGPGWFSKRVSVDDTSGMSAMFLGGVDGDAQVWLNEVLIGSLNGYREAVSLDIRGMLKEGDNTIVIRVSDALEGKGLYGPVVLGSDDAVKKLFRTDVASMPARQSAEWVKDAVLYEVYLRAFSREGTITALKERLPEIKRLGATVIWLMPIHPIGEVNRKGTMGSPYSVQDYFSVNPELGSEEDLRSLVGSAHDLGMKVILDLVANHAAWDSKLMFEHSDWFVTDESGSIVAPNEEWIDVADLNYGHHELRKYMISVMKYWVEEVGVDGYRCDAADFVPLDFWELARGELDGIKPVLMLSEGAKPEHHLKAFDVTYSWSTYDVLEKVIHGNTPVSVFSEIVRNESVRFPQGSLRLRFNTNHDKKSWDAPAVKKFGRGGAKAAAVLIMTLPGIPVIYNGDEAGNEKQLDAFGKSEIDWSKNGEFRTLYERLADLRANHSALRRGDFLPLENDGGPKVLSFMRSHEKDTVLVTMNWSEQKKIVIVRRIEDMPRAWKGAFSGHHVLESEKGMMVELVPMGFEVFVPDRGGI